MPDAALTSLIDFLRARLDKDEQNARTAITDIEAWGGTWEDFADAVWKRTTVEADGIADHIARHDPARVLRRIESGRKLIELCEKQWTHDLRGTEGGLEMALELAAYEYADHEDYCQEWRP
jgi:hypothetical protein